MLALVTALQYVENLTDRQAGQMVARARWDRVRVDNGILAG